MVPVAALPQVRMVTVGILLRWQSAYLSQFPLVFPMYVREIRKHKMEKQKVPLPQRRLYRSPFLSCLRPMQCKIVGHAQISKIVEPKISAPMIMWSLVVVSSS